MARVGEHYYRRDDPAKTIFIVLRFDGHMAHMAASALSTSVQAVHKYELESEWYLDVMDDAAKSESLAAILHSALTTSLKETVDPVALNRAFQRHLRWAPIGELFDWMTSEWWTVEEDPFFKLSASSLAVVRRIVPTVLSGKQINFTQMSESATAVLEGTNLFCVAPTALMALVGLARVIEAKGAPSATEG